MSDSDLKNELEIAQRQAAAMRGALTRIFAETGHALGFKEEYCPHCIAKTALTTDAGREYVSKEQVKPVVDALESVVNSAVHPQIAVRSIMVPLEPIRIALSHARTIGL